MLQSLPNSTRCLIAKYTQRRFVSPLIHNSKHSLGFDATDNTARAKTLKAPSKPPKAMSKMPRSHSILIGCGKLNVPGGSV